MTTPPTDKATLETCDVKHRLSDEQIDALVETLKSDADEHKQFFPSDKSYQTMHGDAVQAITQLRTQRASAETDVESVRLLLTETRTSLAAANKRAEEAEANKACTICTTRAIEAEAMLKSVRTQLAEAKDTLAKYADKQNWGYYDESGCLKGQGTYEDCCVLSPQPARDTLSRLTEANTQENKEE